MVEMQPEFLSVSATTKKGLINPCQEGQLIQDGEKPQNICEKARDLLLRFGKPETAGSKKFYNCLFFILLKSDEIAYLSTSLIPAEFDGREVFLRVNNNFSTDSKRDKSAIFVEINSDGGDKLNLLTISQKSGKAKDWLGKELDQDGITDASEFLFEIEKVLEKKQKKIVINSSEKIKNEHPSIFQSEESMKTFNSIYKNIKESFSQLTQL
jgi:hypothetical protein